MLHIMLAKVICVNIMAQVKPVEIGGHLSETIPSEA